MISPRSVGVKIFSATGALVADYYNNTETNDGLALRLKVLKNGGLDTFVMTLANNAEEPLFTGMICKFYVDGVLWFTGFATSIPEVDTESASIAVEGNGFWHKLKTVIVNEAYTAQTLDYIIKDIASTYLSTDLQVLYDVAKIATPSVTGIDVEFNDKRLDEVFDSLLDICNADFSTAQYRYFVDEERELNFALISTVVSGALFEGFDYQNPNVERVADKLINKILAYRTTAADKNEVEFVASYSDADSVSNHGEQAQKLTFPDYIVTAGIQRVAESLIERFRYPLTKIMVNDVAMTAPADFGFYQIVNKRQRFSRDAANFESISGWDISNLFSTTPTVSTEHVFTNRTALKLVTAAGSAGDYMFKTFNVPVYFPTYFKFYAYLDDAAAAFTVLLTDTFGNDVSVDVGGNNEPIGEWLKFSVPIAIVYAPGLLYVDKDVSNGGLMRVDVDGSTYGNLKLLKLLVDGVLNVSTIRITMDADVASTCYLDQFSLEASAYKQHTLMLEEIEYTLDKTRLANMAFGDSDDNIISEINKQTAAGKAALDVFSKQ